MTGILPGPTGPATTPADPTEPPLVDRTHLLAEIRAALTATGGVLLHGPAGIGKTALLDALAQEAGPAGGTVLRSSPTAAEADLPHLALIDLLGEALPGLAEELPDHLRQALECALLHRAPQPGTPTDPLAVRVAVLEALRRLAQRGPVLVLLDDTQWLDEASRQVIAFTARRLTDRRVRFAVTERTERTEHADAAPEMGALCPPAAREIAVGPLGERGTGALLRERLDLRLSGLTLTRVHTVSGGNPYYALELGRSLAAGGSESALAADPARPLDVPHRLRALVSARLGELPDAARQSLTVLAAARTGTGLPDTVTEPLAAARRHGIVQPTPAGTPQFSHPLIAEVVLADATPAALREAHRLLADLAADPVEQVRHQALAADAADPQLASRLHRAADTALTRGAPGTAAELLRLAADHTPDPDAAGRRLLAAARNAAAAGLPDLARACGERLESAPAADVRVHARLLLARLLGPDHPGAEPLLAAAAEDTGGDPALTAAVHQERAVRALHRGDRAEGLAELATAEKHADQADDPDLLVELLAQRAPLTLLTDPALGLAQLERGCRLAAGRPPPPPPCSAAKDSPSPPCAAATCPAPSPRSKPCAPRSKPPAAPRTSPTSSTSPPPSTNARAAAPRRTPPAAPPTTCANASNPAPARPGCSVAPPNSTAAPPTAPPTCWTPRSAPPRTTTTANGSPTPTDCAAGSNSCAATTRPPPNTSPSANSCCAGWSSPTPPSSWWTPTWPRRSPSPAAPRRPPPPSPTPANAPPGSAARFSPSACTGPKPT
ncbi:ATP-binding protein [Kitasatospora saccharophila]|uniref:ATP-binding protein n=1 Tax=Kitasatospora saccharophila TaxID=407973 RepID=UPI0036343D13